MSSFLISLVAHLIVLLVLAFSLSTAARDPGLPGLSAELLEPTSLDPTPGDPVVEVAPSRNPGSMLEGAETFDLPDVPVLLSGPSLESQQLPVASSSGEPTRTDLARSIVATLQGGYDNRSAGKRAQAAGKRGGNDQSESAVERGLRWLMAQQRPDGSWNFNLENERGERLSSDPGTEASTTASTGLALLAFLGAGYTHRDGAYRDVVQKGLYYLATRARVTADGADLQEGSMYGQGIATMALCEAYGMTEDRNYRDLAQLAVNFIVYAQDKRGGGWRYTPGQPGDTTVTGWQFMAIKSGQMAGLSVPSPTIFQIDRFLDSVQADGGATYGYLDGSEVKPSTTAIGLLCRMYRGWPREHQAIQQGASRLAEWGPSKTDLYYDYYATQVLCHLEGSAWEKWNRSMRDHLVATQVAQGFDSGSWHFSDQYGNKGGRLYSTAMAVMILEVYYRFMPLYGDAVLDGDF